MKEEALFGDAFSGPFPIAIPSRGSKLIGGTIRTELTRSMVNQILVEGFFPKVAWDAKVSEQTRSALSEVGLPYTSDPAVTRHLSDFLRRHAADGEAFAQPSAILFNGGVFQAGLLQARVEAVVNGWLVERGSPSVKVLSSESLNVSVAQGAAYFGTVSKGEGIRIRGGVAHAYYVGVEEAMPAIPGFEPPMNAVCIVPFGTEEGSVLGLPEHVFALRVGQQAEFRLFVSATRKEDAVGDVIEMWEAEDLKELPPVEALLAEQGDCRDHTEVLLETHLTAVGTVQLFCVDRSNVTTVGVLSLTFVQRRHRGANSVRSAVCCRHQY